jgi:hypothetical protein
MVFGPEVTAQLPVRHRGHSSRGWGRLALRVIELFSQRRPYNDSPAPPLVSPLYR